MATFLDLLCLKVLYSIRLGQTWQYGCPTEGLFWCVAGLMRGPTEDTAYRVFSRLGCWSTFGVTQTQCAEGTGEASSSGLGGKAETSLPECVWA